MADTIKVLIATDNHVGYAERDPVRSDDSWKTFHEIMCMAKERDVDMVLLGGDLFHENKPSRKSMYNVMRSLRLNCYGDKPCELELLSDGSEHFDPTIGHANYEDPDINVAIPVFSIHGNHDDPSGEGLYAALDILEMAGLINYFGRVPESDNITVRPLFFQKGSTKLALYGLSNVRDERLHRTFRDGKVTFKRPGVQQQDWFNIMCVHQNHVPHTETSYLPEDPLPDYMDLIVWGHEHDCETVPRKNPEKGFRVLQPGSSIATSLTAGEAIPKHVFLLTLTGREFKTEPVRLKTVRPFIHRDIILSEHKEAVRIAKRNDHRSELTRFLEKIVHGLIEEAHKQWEDAQANAKVAEGQSHEFPKPIIRLRVETTPPDGHTKFELENPQRFSNRFTDTVANRNDVIQYHARKRIQAKIRATAQDVNAEQLLEFENQPEMIKIANLIRTFLDAQALSILPQNYFTDAVEQFIKKDDKHAMEMFVDESLSKQIQNLVRLHREDEDEDEQQQEQNLKTQIDEYRAQLEDLFSKGQLKGTGSAASTLRATEGEDNSGGSESDHSRGLTRSTHGGSNKLNGDHQALSATMQSDTTNGRGPGQGPTATAASRGVSGRRTTRLGAASTSRQKATGHREGDGEDDDIIMLDHEKDNSDDNDNNSQHIFVPQKQRRVVKAKTQKPTATKVSTRKPPVRAAARSTITKQSQLNFGASQPTRGASGSRRATEDSEDIDDDSDDFEPAPSARPRR